MVAIIIIGKFCYKFMRLNINFSPAPETIEHLNNCYLSTEQTIMNPSKLIVQKYHNPKKQRPCFHFNFIWLHAIKALRGTLTEIYWKV